MTIQKPIIEELRYVNGQPDPALRPDQTRINWAKNGESIGGATGDTTSDGVLNRAGVEVQENVLNTHNNTKAQQSTIIELVDTVNELTGGEDADLGTRLTASEFDIQVLQNEMTAVETDVGIPSNENTLATGLHRVTELTNADIGVRNPQDVPNTVENNDTVRKDLYFIKRRIGNDRNYDVNGNLVVDIEPTGMKYQIDDLYNKVATVNQEIGEDNISGTLSGRIFTLESSTQTGSVAAIRDELGSSEDAIENRSVYLRLDDLESASDDHTISIDALDLSISNPVGGIINRLDVIETDVSNINIQLNSNTVTLTDSIADIGTYAVGDLYNGTIKARLSSHTDDLMSLWGRIGATDDDTGTLGARIKGLEGSLGDVNNPIEFTAWYDINVNTADIAALRTDVDSMGPSTLQDRLTELEAPRSFALIASETPETFAITTEFQNISDLIDDMVTVRGFTFMNGVLTRIEGSHEDHMTVAWVMYEGAGDTHEVTIRVEITHPDTSVEISDYERKLRGNLVTPIAISHSVSLVDGSEIRLFIKSNMPGVIEHDSLFVRI